MHLNPSNPLLWALLSATFVGCVSFPNREVRFHEESGLTWASMEEPIVLARAAPQYATTARDYLYVGPLETNRSGRIEHFLWVGVSSTVDRALRGESAPEARAVLLLVDGLPVALPLTPWKEDFAPSPYAAPVPIAGSWHARVALDQIRRIARADSVEVYLVSDTGASARHELWRGSWSTWLAFPARPPGDGLDARLAES